MTNPVGYACGTCLDIGPATVVPDACFACGARFPRDAHAVVRIDVELESGVGLAPAIEFVGAWTRRGREIVRESVGEMLDADDDAPGPADRGNQ